MNMEKTMGFIVGLLVAAVIAALVAVIAKRKGVGRGAYDERQQIARGKAFSMAYFTLLIYLAVWLIMRALEMPFAMQTMSVFIGVLASLGVFVGYSIFHDAYFKASESPRAWITIICAIGLVNLGIGVARLIRSETIVERLYDNMNLFMGLLFMVVLACIVIKRAIDRRGAEE